MTLVAANVALPDPAGVKVVRVETTAAAARRRRLAAAAGADAVVMAAAPADFRPVSVSEHQDQEGRRRLAPRPSSSTQNPDILARARRPTGSARVRSSSASPPRPATTTGTVLELGRAKLARKGCDLLVVNDVSGGAVFGSADNEAVILAADGAAVDVPRGSKSALAHVIWDQVVARMP